MTPHQYHRASNARKLGAAVGALTVQFHRHIRHILGLSRAVKHVFVVQATAHHHLRPSKDYKCASAGFGTSGIARFMRVSCVTSGRSAM